MSDDVVVESESQCGSESAHAIFHVADIGIEEKISRYSSSNILVHASRDFLMSTRVCCEGTPVTGLKAARSYCVKGVSYYLRQYDQKSPANGGRYKQMIVHCTVQGMALNDGDPKPF